MICTYVVRPGDAPEGRGPQFEPFWDNLMNYNLRGGFILHCVGYVLIFLSSLLGGNVFGIFKVLNADSNTIAKTPLLMTLIGTLCCTFGAIYIQNFRNIADDDARTGIKSLNQASLLDLLSCSLTSIILFSCMQFFEDDWASKKAGSNSTEILSAIARTLHSLSLILYGASFFFLENFHAEGTAECWGWTLGTFFKTAGILELLTLTVSNTFLNNVYNILFTITLGISIVLAFLWSLCFEPVVNHTDVKFTQSGMRNEFYKSRNAMAYYGPPSGLEMTPASY